LVREREREKEREIKERGEREVEISGGQEDCHHLRKTFFPTKK